MQHVAIWHWYLLLCIYIIFNNNKNVLLLSIPFSYFKKNLVLINQRNGPRYQHVLALCAFLTGVIPKGLILKKIAFDVCVCFVLCKLVSGLILWFLGNLWFDDLCTE